MIHSKQSQNAVRSFLNRKNLTPKTFADHLQVPKHVSSPAFCFSPPTRPDIQLWPSQARSINASKHHCHPSSLCGYSPPYNPTKKWMATRLEQSFFPWRHSTRTGRFKRHRRYRWRFNTPLRYHSQLGANPNGSYISDTWPINRQRHFWFWRTLLLPHFKHQRPNPIKNIDFYWISQYDYPLWIASNFQPDPSFKPTWIQKLIAILKTRTCPKQARGVCF